MNYVVPRPPQGQKRFIDIWHIELDGIDSSGYLKSTFLAEDELYRASLFRFERDKQRFLARRIALRRILSEYSGIAPDQQIVLRSNQQKPYISNSWVQFNTSHSANIALVGVSSEPIGIDIEQHKEDANELRKLAKSILTPVELNQFNALSKSQTAKSFYQYWTLKEAYLKAIGLGLSIDPRQLEINLASLTVTSVPCMQTAAKWHLMLVKLQQNFSVAIATPDATLTPNLLLFADLID
ncbi:4'-phosphopantetheinyl transferase superfamily protein [Aliiglaciecola sp. LCG003]|uniref:4'-phosphopantetheinyl transferase family protein n=1 Tax=Aliiglaciecola sp. LCG003 TaxID=3053655 RepID=UPI00257308CA|nr:4'-phosphopantetheinyl transferase superfamily protein [Aliiglaciecola sp. LCG003]WJG09757.1 4'-phosphopantetheinyl transferase superfamily protein [Aliiglaciecola sp. LCG003]